LQIPPRISGAGFGTVKRYRKQIGENAMKKATKEMTPTQHRDIERLKAKGTVRFEFNPLDGKVLVWFAFPGGRVQRMRIGKRGGVEYLHP
jgi:hypothetical protein